MEKIVALVVDVQKEIVTENLYNKEMFIDTVQKTLSYLRQKNIEIIYIRHNDGEKGPLKHGNDGWQIHEAVKPLRHEKIFDKDFNSAFKNTGLKEYLDTKGIQTIVLMGLQTEYCLDATCKVAFEYGYRVLVVENTNTTIDNKYICGKSTYEYYNHFIWNGRYATYMTLEQIKEMY